MAANRLPEKLRAWTIASLGRRTAAGLPPVNAPLRIEGNGHTIEVTVLPGNVAHTLLIRRGTATKVVRDTPSGRLTGREIEILEWVEQGMGNADVATLCGISVRTVHKHLQNIFEKFNVENRVAAVRKWRELS